MISGEGGEVTQAAVASVAIQVIFYVNVAFIAGVSFVWPWWRDQLGWSIIAKTAALSVVLFPSMLYFWFGSNAFTQAPWLSWFSTWALFLVPAALVWRFIVIFRIQRQGASHQPYLPRNPEGTP